MTTTRRRAPPETTDDLKLVFVLLARIGLGVLIYVAVGALVVRLVAELWMRGADTSEIPPEFVLGAMFVWLLPLITFSSWLIGIKDIRSKNREALVALLKPSAATVMALLLPLLPSYNKRGLHLVLAVLAIITAHDFAMAYLGRSRATDEARKILWWFVVMGFFVAILFPAEL